MGGNLAITVREPDGKEHRMDRWTNSMPWFVDNIDLVEKRPEHIQDYLKTWNDFVEDWDEHGEAYLAAKVEAEKRAKKEGGYYWDYMPKDKEFTHNMTPVYATHRFLAPSEYGQVVVDMVNNKILHAQGYTDFGVISRIGAVVMLNQEGEKEFWERHPDGAAAHCRLREFFEAGRIKEIFSYTGDTPDMTKIEDIADSKALLEFLRAEDPHWQERREFFMRDEVRDLSWQEREAHPDCPPPWPDEFANFRLDMSPFEVVRFDESETGFRELKQAIIDLGFVLTEEEDQMWEEWLARRYGDDEE
jgi:hypothetical protein